MIFPLIGLKYCWPLVNDKFKHWNVQFESERAYFWTTEQNNPTVIKKKMYVDEDLTWTAFVKEKPINLQWIETQPILNTVEILLNTLQIIDDLKTCKGILIEKSRCTRRKCK